jgi:hypothetical protein
MGSLCCLQQSMLPTGAFAMFGIGPTGLSKAARRAPQPQPPENRPEIEPGSPLTRCVFQQSIVRSIIWQCVSRGWGMDRPTDSHPALDPTPTTIKTLFALTLRWVCGRSEDVQAEHPGQVRGHKLATDAVAREIQPR